MILQAAISLLSVPNLKDQQLSFPILFFYFVLSTLKYTCCRCQVNKGMLVAEEKDGVLTPAHDYLALSQFINRHMKVSVIKNEVLYEQGFF